MRLSVWRMRTTANVIVSVNQYITGKIQNDIFMRTHLLNHIPHNQNRMRHVAPRCEAAFYLLDKILKNIETGKNITSS